LNSAADFKAVPMLTAPTDNGKSLSIHFVDAQGSVTLSMLIPHHFRSGAADCLSSNSSVRFGRVGERQFPIRADIFGDYGGRRGLGDWRDHDFHQPKQIVDDRPAKSAASHSVSR
jgi:hypothetical protein